MNTIIIFIFVFLFTLIFPDIETTKFDIKTSGLGVALLKRFFVTIFMIVIALGLGYATTKTLGLP